MTLAQNVIFLTALGTVALNGLLLAALVLSASRAWRERIRALVAAHARLIVFLLSALSVTLTLWMQYGANLAPCLFCWWQRIFMYPIPLITLIAIVKRVDFSEIADYVLSLSLFGVAIALYQHLLQVLPSGALIPCDATDDCAIRSVFEFHFVTIPWMALTIFAVFIFVAFISRKRSI